MGEKVWQPVGLRQEAAFIAKWRIMRPEVPEGLMPSQLLVSGSCPGPTVLRVMVYPPTEVH